MSRGERIQRDSLGQICLNQYRSTYYDISYNPDDQRFYVHELSGEPGIAVATFKGDYKGYANAIQFVRRKEKGDKFINVKPDTMERLESWRSRQSFRTWDDVITEILNQAEELNS